MNLQPILDSLRSAIGHISPSGVLNFAQFAYIVWQGRENRRLQRILSSEQKTKEQQEQEKDFLVKVSKLEALKKATAARRFYKFILTDRDTELLQEYTFQIAELEAEVEHLRRILGVKSI